MSTNPVQEPFSFDVPPQGPEPALTDEEFIDALIGFKAWLADNPRNPVGDTTT